MDSEEVMILDHCNLSSRDIELPNYEPHHTAAKNDLLGSEPKKIFRFPYMKNYKYL